MFLSTWQALFRMSDSGMRVLYKFFVAFISTISIVFHLTKLKELANILPNNVRSAQKIIGNTADTFIKYASCPNCNSIYHLETCIIKQPGNTFKSRKCSFIPFPNHPHLSQRSHCDTVLMKNVRTSYGTIRLYPRQLFCYQSLISSLKELLKRPGFVTQCELWRRRDCSNNVLRDVYDGRVWNNFLKPEGVPFLSLPFNFALALNVDWFQPFKYSNYSIGVMYYIYSKFATN